MEELLENKIGNKIMKTNIDNSVKKSKLITAIIKKIIFYFFLILIVIIVAGFIFNQIAQEEIKKKMEFKIANIKGIWYLNTITQNKKLTYFKKYNDNSAGMQFEFISSNFAILRVDKNENNRFDDNEIESLTIQIIQEDGNSGIINWGRIWNATITSPNYMEMINIDGNGNKTIMRWEKE